MRKFSWMVSLLGIGLWLVGGGGVSAETPRPASSHNAAAVAQNEDLQRAPAATPQLFDSFRQPSHITTYGQRLFVASSTDCPGGEFPPDCRIYRRHKDAAAGLDIHINPSGTTNNIESNIASDATHTYFQGKFGTISRVLNNYYDNDPESYFATKENASSTGEVAVDENYVYWTENVGDSGKLFRASKATGTRQLMATFDDDPAVNLQVDNQGRAYIRTDVFAIFCCNDIVAQVAPSGGGFTVTYTGITDVHDYVLSNIEIYAAHTDLSNGDVIVKSASLNNLDAPADWTTRETITSSPTIRNMTLSDSALFWQQTTSPNFGPIKRMPFNTSTPTSISTSLSIDNMVRIEDQLYFRYLGGIYSLSIDAEAIANDLDANDVTLEVLQSMQDAAHTVPLLEGRRTFVRAYGRIGSSNQGLTSLSLALGMMLYGTRGGDVLEGSPIRPIINPAFTTATIDRTTMDNTWLFELPDSWAAGDISLTAVANAGRLFDETSYANNSTTQAISFEPVRGLCLDMLSVLTTDGLSVTSGSGLRQHVERAYTMLPVHQFGTVWRGGNARTRPVTNAPYNMSDTGEKLSLMADLTFDFMFAGSPAHCGDWHTVRTIMAPNSDRFGMSNPVAPFIYFLESYTGAPENFPRGGTAGLAHELGHQLQGGHVNCPVSGPGSPDWPYTTLPYPTQCHIDNSNDNIGYDPLSDRLIVPLNGSNQPQYNDLMAYGGPNYPSEFMYRRLLDSLALSRQQVSLARQQVGEKQLAGGYITDNGAVHLDPIYEVDSATATQMQAVIDAGSMSRSDYKLRFTSKDGITDVPLLIQDDFADSAGGLLFLALFEPLVDITNVQLIEGTNAPLLEVEAESQSPTITIVQPATGATISGEYMTISWTVSGGSIDPLYFRVLYSGDGGSSWYEVANTTDMSVSVATDTLPGGDNGRLRVYVSDGLNSGAVDVTGLTLPNSAPLATITPRLNSGNVGGSEISGLVSFPAGSSVEFDAVAFDLEDGPLSEAAFAWRADGFLSYTDVGPTFFAQNMQPGFYELTVTATDGDGLTGSDSMWFRVLPKQVSDGAGVELDGYCDDGGYSAETDPLSISGPADNAQLRMVRSGGDYYICISNMSQYAYADEYVELRFDPNNSQNSTMQSSDTYVRLYRDGRFERGVGSGSGGTTTAAPSVLYAGEATSNELGTFWQAELRIDGSVLPSWDSLIGMSVRHKYSSLTFGLAVWPLGSQLGGPDRWGEVSLGNAIPPTAVTVQHSAAQPSIGVVALPLIMLLAVATAVGIQKKKRLQSN